MLDQSKEEAVSAIRQIIIGSIICEYGCRMLVDGTRQELKGRVKILMNACTSVQNHYLHHASADAGIRETFKKEFLKGEIVLIGELLSAVWGLGEEDLEDIIAQVKKNTDGEPNY